MPLARAMTGTLSEKPKGLRRFLDFHVREPADSRRASKPSGSIKTIVSKKWMRWRRTLQRLSQPAKVLHFVCLLWTAA